MKNKISKIKTWLTDHFHLLFKSAAENHLRIQQCHQNTDGTIRCEINFESYSQLKQYQKKLRRITVSLSSAVAMVIISFIVAPYILNPNKSSASSFVWTQSSWQTTPTGATKQYPGDKTGVTDYTTKSSNIAISSNKITMATPQTATKTDSSFVSAPNGTYVSGGMIYLKKVAGGNCNAPGECVSGDCSSNVCVTPCSANVVCGEVCKFDNLIYGTVATPEGKCWLDRNLGATQVAASLTDSNAYGWLYQWGRLTDGHQLRSSTSISTLSTTDVPGHGNNIGNNNSPYFWRSTFNSSLWQGVNGINNPCPPGFKVPTNTEWTNLINANGVSLLKLSYGGNRSYGTGNTVTGAGSYGSYWASTTSGGTAYYFNMSSTATSWPGYSNSVRCIKN